jgi:hypothetical protein
MPSDLEPVEPDMAAFGIDQMSSMLCLALAITGNFASKSCCHPTDETKFR